VLSLGKEYQKVYKACRQMVYLDDFCININKLAFMLRENRRFPKILERVGTNFKNKRYENDKL